MGIALKLFMIVNLGKLLGKLVVLLDVCRAVDT